jgi:hypothetical protein
MYSEYSLCYFYCCIYNRDKSKPCCDGNIFFQLIQKLLSGLLVGLSIIVALAFVFGIFILLGYMSNHISGDYSNNLLECNFDENFSTLYCFTDGIIYFTYCIACMMAIFILLSPTYLSSGTSSSECMNHWKKTQIIAIPLYFFGVELFGAIVTYIVRIQIKTFNQCNFESYYNFFSFNCKINGTICIFAISLVFWIIYGIYKLILKIKSFHHTLRKIQNNYGSMEAGTL